MSTINPKKFVSPDGSVVTWIWENLGQGDDGAPIKVPEYADKTVQVLGNFSGSAVCDIEGSCGAIASGAHSAPSTDAHYSILHDPGGTALEIGAAGAEAILENPLWIRPNIAAGDGSADLDCFIVCRRPTDLRT